MQSVYATHILTYGQGQMYTLMTPNTFPFVFFFYLNFANFKHKFIDSFVYCSGGQMVHEIAHVTVYFCTFGAPHIQ